MERELLCPHQAPSSPSSLPPGPPSPCREPCKGEVGSQAGSIRLRSSSASLSQSQGLGPSLIPFPSWASSQRLAGLRVMEKEGCPHLEDFSIGAATQPLQQVIVIPGVPVKDVGVHELHPWGLELGLRPGASRASGLECGTSLPPHTSCALHPPCLASTGCGLPPPHSRFLPQHRAVQPAPPPVPWALRACEGQLALGPRGAPPPPPGPRAECKPDANYLVIWGGGGGVPGTPSRILGGG